MAICCSSTVFFMCLYFAFMTVDFSLASGRSGQFDHIFVQLALVEHLRPVYCWPLFCSAIFATSATDVAKLYFSS